MKLPSVLKRVRIDRRTIRPDMMSDLVLGVESVPDALASGVLAGVNPLFGLSAVMLATPVGAFYMDPLTRRPVQSLPGSCRPRPLPADA